MPEAGSLLDGWQTYGSQYKSFIMRNCSPRDFRFELSVVMEKLKSYPPTFGYKNSVDKVENITLTDVLDAWSNDDTQHPTWNMSFVDSPMPDLLTKDNVSSEVKSIGKTSDDLMMVLTTTGAHTPFHNDPMKDYVDGGGWMCLFQGHKTWTLVDLGQPQLFDALVDKDVLEVRDVNIAELVQVAGLAASGIYQGEIWAGDFLCFPPGMAHSVDSDLKCLGVGGYTKCMSSAPKVAQQLLALHRNAESLPAASTNTCAYCSLGLFWESAVSIKP